MITHKFYKWTAIIGLRLILFALSGLYNLVRIRIIIIPLTALLNSMFVRTICFWPRLYCSLSQHLPNRRTIWDVIVNHITFLISGKLELVVIYARKLFYQPLCTVLRRGREPDALPSQDKAKEESTTHRPKEQPSRDTPVIRHFR